MIHLGGMNCVNGTRPTRCLINHNVLSKKRNDMKDEILQIAYSLEKGKIDEDTAKQELI